MELKFKETFTNENITAEKIPTIKAFQSKFLLHTEGSHSVRYNSISFCNNDYLIYPCGIYLNKFSIKENKIEKTLFIDNSIIINVQTKENYIIAVCYNGKGALINKIDFSISKKFEFENSNTISNVSFSDDLNTIAISAEFYKDKDTVKTVYGACGVLVWNEFNSRFDIVHVIKRNDCFVEINCDNDLVVIEKVYMQDIDSIIDEEEKNAQLKQFDYRFSLINLSLFLNKYKEYINKNNNNYFNNKNESYGNKKDDLIQKPNLEDYLVLEKLFNKNEEISFIMKSEKSEYIGISFYKRNVLLLDLKSLDALLSIEIEGKGFLGAMEISNNKLYLTNKARSIISLDIEGLLTNKLNNSESNIITEKQIEHNYEYDYLKVKLNNEVFLNSEKIANEKITCLLKELILNNPLVHFLNYCLRVSPDGKSICWVNESGLHVNSNFSNLEAVSITRNSPIKMTGVGLSISKNADYFAVGDLEGNINIYKIYYIENNSKIVKNIYTLKTFDSIRCLEWSEDDNLYIGCMSGKLFQAHKTNVNNENNLFELTKETQENFELYLIDNLHCTITCIRIHPLHLDNNDKDENTNDNQNDNQNKDENNSKNKTKNSKLIKNFIFLSTTKGIISILCICKHGFLRVKDFLAHPPQPENLDLRFGSLRLRAEVWSIALKEKYKNKSENKLILNVFSASEDQMVKIWEINLFDLYNYKDILNEICCKHEVKLASNEVKSLFKFEEVKAYKNHTLAVTSVDCKIVKIQDKRKMILATCSDDKLINIYDADDYNGNEFSFIGSLTTKHHVVGWHTITYLSLEENGHRLAVGTQNGFLVIFSLLDFSVLFCEKIHLGGIEGLSWKKDTIVTCSSDLNLEIIKIQ